MKICTQCKRVRPLFEFVNHATKAPTNKKCRGCLAGPTAKRNRRRVKIRQATPAWFERVTVKYFYRIVRTMDGQSVDHVIPLTSDLVSGLHCLDNLQVMPAKENHAKRNDFDQDAESERQLHITRGKLAQ